MLIDLTNHEPEHAKKVAYIQNNHDKLERFESVWKIEHQLYVIEVLIFVFTIFRVLGNLPIDSSFVDIFETVDEFLDVKNIKAFLNSI